VLFLRLYVRYIVPSRSIVGWDYLSVAGIIERTYLREYMSTWVVPAIIDPGVLWTDVENEEL
jgi:hypothetical protein